MSCFPCFKSKEPENDKGPAVPVAQAREPVQSSSTSQARPQSQASPKPNSPPDANNGNSSAKTFTFRELATACKNFRQECLIGEGAFGKLFKGTLQPNAQVVMVKNLDKNSMHGNKEFTVEVMMLTLLQHPNLLKLIGYCADGDQRLLVYEYMPKGTVEDHLLDPTHQKKPLDWTTRMKIAAGAAEGLEYLHEKANPPIIYRDLKSSSILLDEEFNPKLSDYGLAKLTSGGNSNHLPPRVMGNYGYCAPEYERQGELTVKSDVYSFGVILLELISGRRALDTSRPADEQNLVAWAQPIFRDPKRFPDLADPLLKDKYPVRSLNQAVGVAAMCLQDEPEVRPLIEDIVAALSFLAVAAPDEPVPKSILQSSVSLANLNRENSCYKEMQQESHNNHQENVADDHHNGNESDNKDQEQEDNESEVSSESSDDEEDDQVANVKSDNTDDRNGGYDYDSDEISMTSDDTDYEDEEENEQARAKSVKKGSSSRKNPGEVDFEIGSMSSDSRNSSLDKSEHGSIKENSLSVKSTKKAKKPYANTGRAISERRGKKESGNGGPGLSSVHSYHPGSSGLGS